MRVTASRLRRHLFAVRGIASDRRIDAPARLEQPPHQREILLLDLAIMKLTRELFVRCVMFGDDHQP
jgi:hypothetical protein